MRLRAIAFIVIVAAYLPPGAPASPAPDAEHGARQVLAQAPELHPAEEPAADPPAPQAGVTAVQHALSQIGKPYQWGATGPHGFDCSGLMLASWEAAGVELPRTSSRQFELVERVPLDQLEVGDLVFSGPGRVDHVGMYIGDGLMVHSPRSGRHVEVSELHANLLGAGRPSAPAASGEHVQASA